MTVRETLAYIAERFEESQPQMLDMECELIDYSSVTYPYGSEAKELTVDYLDDAGGVSAHGVGSTKTNKE